MRAIIFAALVLGGCAGNYPVYYKDGVMLKDGNEDAYACLRDAKAVGGAAYVGFGITERTVDWNMYHMCMRTRGWTLQ